jgi:MFS family permease
MMTDNIEHKRYRPQFINNIYKPEVKVGRFLSVLILFGVAFGLKRGVQDNYLADIILIEPFERGIVEFFRESPGLLLIFILALMYKYADSKIFKIGIAMMVGGLAGLLLTSSVHFILIKFLVVFFMVLFSAGEHIIMPVRSTIAMELAKKEKTGASLGMITSINQLGNIAGFLIVSVVFFVLARFGITRIDILGYRIIFGISTALIVAALLVAAALQETTLKAPRQRFYFAKKYTKYYLLEIFYGARKQVFLTFAPYVLILEYGADPALMAFLYLICSVFVMFFSPLIGKLIDVVGYKIVMVVDTLILIVVCFLYGFAHRLFSFNVAFIVVCCNFVLDQIISIASMASNVYVKRISKDQEEITATLSTGISVNHVISILIALLGGWIWKVSGIETLFMLSALLGFISSINAATIKKSEEILK